MASIQNAWVFGLVLIFIAVIVYQSVPFFYKTYTLDISPEEARTRRFSLIIDVRTPEEREEWGYYPNSNPIPLDRLAAELPQLIADKNADLLVYANGDSRAMKAAQIAYDLGYHSVRYLTGTYVAMLPPGSHRGMGF